LFYIKYRTFRELSSTINISIMQILKLSFMGDFIYIFEAIDFVQLSADMSHISQFKVKLDRFAGLVRMKYIRCQ